MSKQYVGQENLLSMQSRDLYIPSTLEHIDRKFCNTLRCFEKKNYRILLSMNESLKFCNTLRGFEKKFYRTLLSMNESLPDGFCFNSLKIPP